MNSDQTGKKLSDVEKQKDEEEEEEEDLTPHLKFRRHAIHLGNSLSQLYVMLAVEKCKSETVLKWLRDKSQSEYFSKLADVFLFFEKKIEEEEEKNHDNRVDIIFVAHGAIRDVMIPACCLLPLPAITDVVLYSPWNCATSARLTYALATGRLRPSHRVFVSKTDSNCKTPAPDKLPNRWNSMKEAGEKMIPNISVSPLKPDDGVWKRYKSLREKHGSPGRNRIVIRLKPDDGVWKRYKSLREKHGSPGRNRIVIPFKFPEVTVGSVPFSVVSLALSLVLRSSRFTATVHLDACLTDHSQGKKFDPEYLRSQYAYTPDNTLMTVPDDMFIESLFGRMRLY